MLSSWHAQTHHLLLANIHSRRRLERLTYNNPCHRSATYLPFYIRAGIIQVLHGDTSYGGDNRATTHGGDKRGPIRRVKRSERARCTSGGACSHDIRRVSRGKRGRKCRLKQSSSRPLKAFRVAVASGERAAASSRMLARRMRLCPPSLSCTQPTACAQSGVGEHVHGAG